MSKLTKVDEINNEHLLHLSDLEAKDELSYPTFLTVIGQGMSVTQHFQESEKKSAVAVLMQLKSGGILEWLSLKGSNKVITSIRISDINFIIWGRAGTKPRVVSEIQSKFEHQLIHENRMFGIVTKDNCYDFEAISKEERDALCSGLSQLAIRS